jgi:poly-gamma-glutamate capsule biosynthesis protein CapA/YwtB (metallophosphatase superfamily)
LAFLSYTSTFVPGTFPAGENKIGLATVAVSTAYEISGNIRYAPGVPPRIITTPNRRDVEMVLEDIQQAKARADLVVVSWHWGLTKWANAFAMGIPVENAPFFVLNYQEDMGRAAIDAGADLIMGHHPHRLQGMEVYKGKLICYSLNNLAISFGEGPNFGEESVIVKGYIDPKRKQITRLTFSPIMLPHETMEPYPVPVAQAGDYVTLMTQLSRKYGTRFRVEGDEIAIERA